MADFLFIYMYKPFEWMLSIGRQKFIIFKPFNQSSIALNRLIIFLKALERITKRYTVVISFPIETDNHECPFNLSQSYFKVVRSQCLVDPGN